MLHFHIDLMQFPLLRTLRTPSVTTPRTPGIPAGLGPLYRTFPDQALVSVSDSQRLPLPPVRWVGTVQHGLPRELVLLRTSPCSRALSGLSGRISPEKCPDRAIEIATRAGLPLRIAAKIDAADRRYWRTDIEPIVRRNPLVEFVGEIGEADKAAFLGGAAALLFPDRLARPLSP